MAGSLASAVHVKGVAEPRVAMLGGEAHPALGKAWVGDECLARPVSATSQLGPASLAWPCE